MKNLSILILKSISFLLLIPNSGSHQLAEKLKKLECEEFYVKIFDTSSNSYDYTCQNYVPWDDYSNIFCTDYKEMPYVIVYTTINSSVSITYYKVCCRTKECLNKYRFNPLTRFGKNEPSVKIRPLLSESDVADLDLFVQHCVAAVMVLGVSWGFYYVIVRRPQKTRSWNDSQEFVDPKLLELAQKPRMQTVHISHKDLGGTPISGHFSFLDYCRILASRSYREQNAQLGQLVQPSTIRDRIIRHDLRQVREARESNILKWKIAYHRLNRNKKFVKIGGKWVYVSRNMERNGFLDRNLRIQNSRAIQRYTDAQKMVLHLRTKFHFDKKWMADFDKYDINELMSMLEKRKDKFMIFFKASGLAHHLFRADRPLSGDVKHGNMFESIIFHGPYFYPWEPQQLIDLFTEGREKFLDDNICLKLSLPIVIIGEIRGRYADLHRWLQILGLPYRRKLLFLGGYTNRGSSRFEEYSLDTLAMIAALKIAYPRHVFMLRGSAECEFSFAPRWSAKTDDAVLRTARQMCDCLPLLATIGTEYMAVSSGLSPFMTFDLDEIQNLKRPLKADNLPYYAKWLLFGQPKAMDGMFENEPGSGKYRYGLRAVDFICEKLKIKSIIRSRNELTVNPLFLANERLITISSTPTKHSGGVVLVIDKPIGYMFFKLKLQTTKITIPPRKDTVAVVNEVGKMQFKNRKKRLEKEKREKIRREKEEKKRLETEKRRKELRDRWDQYALEKMKKEEEIERNKTPEERKRDREEAEKRRQERKAERKARKEAEIQKAKETPILRPTRMATIEDINRQKEENRRKAKEAAEAKKKKEQEMRERENRQKEEIKRKAKELAEVKRKKEEEEKRKAKEAAEANRKKEEELKEKKKKAERRKYDVYNQIMRELIGEGLVKLDTEECPAMYEKGTYEEDLTIEEAEAQQVREEILKERGGISRKEEKYEKNQENEKKKLKEKEEAEKKDKKKNKDEKKKKSILKPVELPLDAKRKLIAMGVKKKKSDYATMDDVPSDWDDKVPPKEPKSKKPDKEKPKKKTTSLYHTIDDVPSDWDDK
ncbi:unnamed protein product [Caenorhabditis nigoni]